MDPETFFPAPSEPADAAVALCRTCPVQGSCLAWALQAGDLHGVWGGTTARERRAMAVVWHSGQHDPMVGDRLPGDRLAPDPLTADPLIDDPLAGDPLAGDPLAGERLAGDRLAPDPLAGDPTAHPPAPPALPAQLPGVGPAMDRAELLRLVKSG